MNKIKIILSVLMAVLIGIISSTAQSQDNKSQSFNLFKIERNKNANIVVYDAVLASDGTLEQKNPVDAYWLLNAKDGRRWELGTFDKRAYGYQTVLKDGVYTLTLKAVPDKPITIVFVNGKPKGEILINNQRAYLDKVYVFATDAFIPSVIYYTLTGTDIKTGMQITEKIDKQ